MEMDKIEFPDNLIFDIKDIVSAFMLVYKTGGESLTKYDHVFIEEVISTIYPAIMDLENFESILGQQMIYFADGTIRYEDNIDGEQRSLLMDGATIMAQDLVTLLKIEQAYINNYFPYAFRQLTSDYSVIFELAPELVGDRYCVIN